MRLDKFLRGLEDYSFFKGCYGWISICLFAMVFLTSSFMVTNDIMPSSVVIGLWLMLFCFLITRKEYMRNKDIAPAVLLCLLFVLSYIANEENLMNGISLLFSFFVAILLFYKAAFRDFKGAYLYVLTCLCWISVICYVAYSLVPQLDSLFVVIRPDGHAFSNAFLYVSDTCEIIKRNQGLFWEPGAFQAFISIALLFELFSITPSFRRVSLFVITIITTYSTTGYIAILLCFFAYYFKGASGVNNSKKASWGITILLLGIILFFSQLSLEDNSNPFFKLFDFYDTQGWTDNTELTSASVRFFSIVIPFQAFLERPLFGYGYDGLIKYTQLYTSGMNTCTMINWFALYGVFFGLIMCRGYYRLSKYFSGKFCMNVMAFICMFIITMSENFAANAFFFLLAVYGLKSNISVESSY